MLVNRKELIDALSIVKPGLAKRESITQTTSFAFINGHVVTYNDAISIKHPVKGIDIQGAVAAEPLYKLLEKLQEDKKGQAEDMVEIEIINNELRIKRGRMRAGLALQAEILLPLQELEREKEWEELPERYNEALAFTVSACSKELQRPVLMCVHTNKDGFVEASDGYRIARFTLDKEWAQSFLLPASSIIDVITIAPTHMSMGKSWVHFKNANDTIISCRLYEGNYPQITPHTVIADGVQIAFPRTTLDVLEHALVFATRDNFLAESVTVSLDKNKFLMRSENEIGWLEEELKVIYEGTPLSFSIMPYLLKDVLTKTLDCELGRDRLKFTGENWLYVSLLRNK